MLGYNFEFTSRLESLGLEFVGLENIGHAEQLF